MEPNKVHDFDLRIRRAFFAEGRNIGKRETMLDLAGDASLDVSLFTRLLDSDDSRASVLKEAKLGKERFVVRGTPSIMLSDGTRLRHAMVFPHLRERKIVAVDRLPCYIEDCLESTVLLLDRMNDPQSASTFEPTFQAYKGGCIPEYTGSILNDSSGSADCKW